MTRATDKAVAGSRRRVLQTKAPIQDQGVGKLKHVPIGGGR